MNSKETFSRDAAHIIGLQSYFRPRFSTVKHMKFICNLINHVIKSLHICEEFGIECKMQQILGEFYRCEDCACMLHIISTRAQISQNVKYWYEICDVLVPIFQFVKFTKCEIYGS